MAEPPKSTKKKTTKGDPSEGTIIKPLLINDWSEAQILNYYNACGINFSEAIHDYIKHIHFVELKRLASGPAETSSVVSKN